VHAAEGTREVLEFRERLDELDRSLGEELRRRSAGAPRATIRQALEAAGQIASIPALWGLGKIGGLVSRLDQLSSSERADEFGLDPEFEELVAPLFLFLYRRWFRVEVEGIDEVPASGPALLVANHSGAMFPYDGAMLKVALRIDHPAARELRPLVDDFVFQLPFAGSLMARVGGVRACPANAERLLGRGAVVSVFPEGLRGMQKPFQERYRLQRFGRGGFVTLALRTGAPIVPIAIVGAEEIHPLLGSVGWPAKLVGLPYLPLTPTFPWLGILGLVPLPSKWRIRFGAPIDLDRRHRGADPEDRALVDRITEDVRERIQDMLDEMVRDRRSVFG
jgi:1-acyl-sn-glycerol-3-phosphate acyltransferase